MRIAIVTTKSWFTSKTIGGAEKQIYYISKALIKAGHIVDLYTMDIDKSFIKEGVNIIPTWNPRKGIPKLRYITYRLPALKKQLKSINYDIVYMRGRSLYSASVIKALYSTKTITVIGIAHDSNLSWRTWKQSFPTRSKWGDFFSWLNLKYFHAFSLRLADVVITQNDYQSEIAKKYSTNVLLCPNIIQNNMKKNSPQHIVYSDVVWIGGLRLEKGIESLFQIIDSLPKIKFTVIGETTGSRQYHISKKLMQKHNVIYLNHVDNNSIHGILRASKLLLNTSPHEGFSNTFLEAWLSGIPVIALHVNPSKLLSDMKLGYCANGDKDALIKNMLYLLNNKSLRTEMGNYAKKYVLKEHNADKVVQLFEKIGSSTMM